jgi:hypothetical protein
MTDPIDESVRPSAGDDVNEADAQEQAEPVGEPEQAIQPSDDPEADEFDAAEQSRTVEYDPDEYR